MSFNDDYYYTAFVAWPFDESIKSFPAALAAAKRGDASIEEIDVEAKTQREARAEVKRILDEQYDPGGIIIQWERRVHGVIYF